MRAFLSDREARDMAVRLMGIPDAQELLRRTVVAGQAAERELRRILDETEPPDTWRPGRGNRSYAAWENYSRWARERRATSARYALAVALASFASSLEAR